MMAIENLIARGTLDQSPVYGQVAAVSVGLYKGRPVLDLDYAEDSVAETDMNIVMNDAGAFIEVQGTAEGHAFRRNELDALLDLAAQGVKSIMEAQTSSLAAWRTKR
jgi:ribonuclease PH